MLEVLEQTLLIKNLCGLWTYYDFKEKASKNMFIVYDTTCPDISISFALKVKKCTHFEISKIDEVVPEIGRVELPLTKLLNQK